MTQAAILAFLTCALLLAAPSPSPAACEPDGEVQFICWPSSPEDLAVLPDSPWVIVSSMVDNGHLHLADARDYTTTVLYPTETTHPRHDTATYGSCPGPVTTQFRPHGLYLRLGSGDTHTLLVVRHGAREAIEVFEIGMSGASPTITWVGCAVAPEGIGLNSVVALPEGGFAATSPAAGNIWEWHSGTGWSIVPGSEQIGPNGLEISADGQWFYVGGYGDQALILLSRGRTPVEKTPIPVGFHIDNVRSGPNGTLFAAGHVGQTPDAIRNCLRERQCDGITSHVSHVDPERKTAKEIVSYPSNDLLILGTVAIQHGDEIWVGGVAEGERIARFPAPQ